MPSIAVVGLQFGDEGKGKIVDILSKQARHIARAQGGNNAGHTVVANHREFKLHLVPSGILYPHAKCYIGAGTVIDPASFFEELAYLQQQGIDISGRLYLSSLAHLIFPYHRLLDRLADQAKGKDAIGTTGRGIGPCYVDKVNRLGFRIADLLDANHFEERLASVVAMKNREIQSLYHHAPLCFEEILEEAKGFKEKFLPWVAPVEEMLLSALEGQERVLFEGAQGALLDTTFGTYPFVTSSCTLGGGICTGLGIGPSCIERTLGVAKLYTTRVGNGPFPTELSENERHLFPDSRSCREMGTTTGRERRIGWLDTYLLKRSIQLNGITDLALMKIDVLDELKEIKLCTGYKKCKFFPSDLSRVEPIYETHPGWEESTKGLQQYQDLPSNAKAYVRRIEELLGVGITLISTGPDRKDVIWLQEGF